MRRDLVGRDRCLEALDRALGQVTAGRGGLVLLTGEAGIGKTALMAAGADAAAERGALVAHGACWDGPGAPGYWPWIQVVRSVERAVEAVEWKRAREAAGDGLARLLGEGDAPPEGPGGGTDDGGFRLFEAVTAVLLEIARSRPVVVLLDDLHWADVASVRLLEFLVRHAAFDPVLVVAACRDRDVVDDALGAQLAALQRAATVVPVGGLGVDAAAELIAREAGAPPDPTTVEEIHRRTAGNPFFIEQVVRLVRSGGSVGSVPPGVREVVDRRLARLPSGCAELLLTASLLGNEFTAGLLAEVASTGVSPPSPAGVLDALAPAVTSGLLEANGPAVRFVHDIVRETVLGSLDSTDRRRRHAAIVRALAHAAPVAVPRADTASSLLAAQLAHHAHAAVPEIAAADALAYLVAAADEASARLAVDEASVHLTHALDLVEHGTPTWATIALDLGTAQHRAGALEAARATFVAVADASREAGDTERLVLAALGYHALGQPSDQGRGFGLVLIDEAMARAASCASLSEALRARLVAAASQTRTHLLDQDREEGERLSAEAVRLARSSGDAGALGFALLARHDAIWCAGTARERLAIAEEMADVAQAIRDRELALQASLLAFVALLELGDPASFDELRRFDAMAEHARLPRFRYAAVSRRATVAILEGRFREGMRWADDARRLGEQIGEVDTLGVWHDQAWEAARMEGRYDAIDDLIAERRSAGDPLAVVVQAVNELDRGDVERAVRRLDEVEDLGRRWPRWADLLWLTIRAQLAVASGDRARRAAARDAIAPVRDQWAVLAGGVLVHGPLSYWGAIVDAADGRWPEAIAGFRQAIESATRLGAAPWSALARLGQAEALLGGGRSGDVTAALELLTEAERDAAAIGMAGTVDRARRVRESVAGIEAVRRPVENEFRCDGAVWMLSFAGHTVAMPNAKGLRDLHELLRRPGVDVPVGELFDPAAAGVVMAASRAGADAVLDDRAKAAYRRRLAEIDDAIDAAVRRHDDARAAALDEERGLLVDELRRAAGLGGRARRLGDDRERVRKTVTARIHDVLRRLDRCHPELAEHLRASVSTGARCRYQPASEVRWSL